MAGIHPVEASPDTPYHRISGIVAVNMIMAGASGGVVAVSIAVWAQVRSQQKFTFLTSYSFRTAKFYQDYS